VKSRTKVALLFGGVSAEHDVSISSAESISRSIDRDRFDTIYIGIDKAGRWFMGDSAFDFLRQNTSSMPVRVILSTDPEKRGLLELDNPGKIIYIDVVFPVLHGPRGEDGTIQGMLDIAGIPYVGCGTLASAIAMDKDMTKRVLKESGIPIVPGISIYKKEWTGKKEETLGRILASFKPPLFVKPACMGSSIGITRVTNPKDLPAALDMALGFSEKAIVEPAVENPLEIEVAILGNLEPMASIPGQIIPSGEFYDFEAKYMDSASELIIPARIDDALSDKIRETALDAFKAIGASGLARIDFLVSRGTFYLNEINTLPGFTSISMYPKLWEATGIPYKALITRLIELAMERHEELSDLQKTIELKERLNA